MRRYPNLSRAIVTAALLLSPLLSSPFLAAQPPSPFYLHDGDSVVFYGDSITDQRFYTHIVEVYTLTRFPHSHIAFTNAGYGGDRVTGGGAGPIDLRLSRDVFPFKPTVVTIMLGMNDGSYRPLTPEIESTYTHGYEHILDSLQKTLPNIRISLLGPSPYDEVTRPEMFPGGYNSTLVRFSQIDSELAQKYKSTYIDLNAPFVAAIKRGNALMPTATELLIPDRVHPEELAHWFMADAVLKGWNAPALVSSVTIDAASANLPKLIDQQSAHVTNLAATGDSIAWTELDDALPLPIAKDNAGFAFIFQLKEILADLDQQPLKVTGLKPGSYQLTIDGSPIAKFTAAELETGINLAEYGTPMRGQAYQVTWLARDRAKTHQVRMQMLLAERAHALPAEPTASELLKFEEFQQKQLYDVAQPLPHQFKLSPVTPTP